MKLAFIVLLCFGLATAALADVKLVQKVKTGPMMGQPAKDTVVTMYIKGQKARSESADGKTYQLMDNTTGKVYIVNPEKKTAMVMTTEMLKQTMEMMSQLSGGGKSKPAVEKLGTSHTYNGFKCQDVKITTGANPAFGVSAVSCVSPDIDVKEFEAYKDFTQSFAKSFGVDLDGGMPGYSVHSDIKMNMMGKSIDCTSDLLSISHDKLEDSLFVLPAGYTVREAKAPPVQKP